MYNGTSVKALVLAAGKGTRLQSDLYNMPKVMRLAAGRPLLAWVLDNLNFLPVEDIILVVGYMQEKIREQFSNYTFAEQVEQKGTGHAVLCARNLLKDFDGAILVCCGDMPLMKKSSYRELLNEHIKNDNACTLLSGTSDEPLSYGRIVRDLFGNFERIVEEKDATEAERAIKELNAGVYVFNSKWLFSCLDDLKSDNAQGEYYLTDVPRMIKERGGNVGVCCSCLGDELLGVNTPEQLIQAEKILCQD